MTMTRNQVWTKAMMDLRAGMLMALFTRCTIACSK